MDHACCSLDFVQVNFSSPLRLAVSTSGEAVVGEGEGEAGSLDPALTGVVKLFTGPTGAGSGGGEGETGSLEDEGEALEIAAVGGAGNKVVMTLRGEGLTWR